MDRIMA